MVTSRQVARGITRALRAIDREAKRAERRRIAYQMAAQKQAVLEAGADAAAEYQKIIESITGAHRLNFQRRDWLAIAKATKMSAPERSSFEEETARAALANYTPGWFAKIFGMEKRRRAKLAAAIEAARGRDEVGLRARQTEAENEIEFAQKLVAGEYGAIATALRRYSSLSQLPFAVEGVDVLFTDDGRIIAMVDGLDLEDMPTRSVTLLQSGKASIKALPKTRLLELHRNNICSAAARVALEFLQILPIDVVEVVMHTDLLNSGTGHIGSEPVLYLRVATQAVSNLNLPRTEASALIERLGGHFEWDKRAGFRAIDLGAFNVPADEAQRISA